MSGYLIKDTTKEERIALIRSWQEPDDCVGGSGMDLFDMYDAYIRGEKEIAEINGEFQASYVKDTEDLEQPEEAKSTSGELTQLTKLHAEGALTDEEFAAAKKKVLGLKVKFAYRPTTTAQDKSLSPALYRVSKRLAN